MPRKSSPKKKAPAKKPAFTRPDFLEGEFSLPKIEERVLTFWKDRGIFEKSVAQNASKGKNAAAKNFIFYEGPPYANGKPALHHILARVVKDIVLRYKTMQGYSVPRARWMGYARITCRDGGRKSAGLQV